ncbi:MAG: hypothetical protein BWY78_01273 [Alphaproteobacteria bacterium ADurb.Bin438]|nr:MAG: hypothetical protein BWY78_01273 [Alphaproteobacteria bacterium ADurb.Bin438]
MFSIIKNEWDNNGFIPVEELTKRVFANLMEESENSIVDAKKNDIVSMLIDSSVKKDELTGFYSKKICPLLTGLADLYAKSTGHSVIRVDGDFSNMGGTNEYFKSELQKQDNRGKRQYDGFKETDTLVSVVSAVTFMTYKETVDQHNIDSKTPTAFLYAVRAGGDEIRFIITGLNKDQTDRCMIDAEKRIDDLLANGSLQTHDNPKDEKRPGFGLSLADIDLNNVKDPSLVSTIIDAKIASKKLIQSVPNLLKKAQVEPENAEKLAKYASTITSDFNKSLAKELKTQGLSKQEIQKEVIARDKAFAIKKNFALNNPTPNVPNNPYASKPLAFIRTVSDNKLYDDFLKLSSKENTQVGIKYGENDLFVDRYDALKNNLDTYIKQFGITSKKDIALIHRASHEVRNIDPSTGVKMRAEMIEDAQRFVKDAEKINKKHGLNNENKIKATHIEFTNLAGVNNISHEHGDALLKDYAKVIKSVLNETGMKDFSHAIYSEGGGKFKILLPETYETLNEKGEKVLKHISEKDVLEIGKKISEKTEKDINSVNLVEYFEKKGLSTDFSAVSDEKMKAVLSNPDAKISDIPNPKRDFEKGIKACVNVADIRGDKDVSLQLDELTNTAEAERRAERDNQMKKRDAAKLTSEKIRSMVTNKKVILAPPGRKDYKYILKQTGKSR